ncbi:hypothetical protein LTR86_002294 [Recurvomyces mirabilis]|nr:hypothetical protein LTR86_002294 [Recurvomyces mirabilis]
MATAVFDIPELLESVLLRFDTVDLQRARRVNKQWHATVDCSVRIQRALFHAADKVPDLADPFRRYKVDTGRIAAPTRKLSRTTRYSLHPIIKPAMRDVGLRTAMQKFARTSLKDSYLTRPAAHSAYLWCEVFTERWKTTFIHLDEYETFSTLLDKIGASPGPSASEDKEQRWRLEWVDYHDGERPCY